MKFEKTKFGSIVISGKKYKHDVYLHTEGSITKRDKSHSERMNGHKELSKWELEKMLKNEPEIFFVGMGQSGVLPISNETEKWLHSTLEEKNIKMIRKKTPNILNEVNEVLEQGKKVSGIFHTTC
ncbi:MAG: hypothetical protein GF317_15815 [Candidatus Lokiarchaeota archaeon]|nr:hypothetical protein [Candidatus Lokiarchaeota archaeon]MBD3201017.1 hypothetical protein [Candidatus Lokiarchaeota archaeon]